MFVIRLKKWEMDSYVYAPKDDYKHRAYWRELYTVEEAEHLSGLISAAQENGITFYYALSPGLDIVYSSAKEVRKTISDCILHLKCSIITLVCRFQQSKENWTKYRSLGVLHLLYYLMILNQRCLRLTRKFSSHLHMLR